ncbi:MAG: nucleoside phosphorylase [Bacteroidales bacterium]|nr:nucleoside phosphorylase [Bacteroidales bacterium]
MKKDSELVLASDGSVYHLHLTHDTLADNVLLVGDPGRVDMFKSVFDTVEHEACNRELHSLTGLYHGVRFTALSTGMGCDNIDIVMTELDAAANLDLHTGERLGNHRQLRLVRLGTCGGLQPDLPAGTFVASRYAIGLDGLLHYYQHDASVLENAVAESFAQHVRLASEMAYPYAAHCGESLLECVAHDLRQGITVTAPGFYGPQGRDVCVRPRISDLTERLSSFQWQGYNVCNLEMETSAIYGMSQLMGHQALTVCLVIANRLAGSFLNDYHAEMRSMIGMVMERLAL